MSVPSLLVQPTIEQQLPSTPAAALAVVRASLDALAAKLGQSLEATVLATAAGGLTQVRVGSETLTLQLSQPLAPGTPVKLTVQPGANGAVQVTLQLLPANPLLAPAVLPTLARTVPAQPLMPALAAGFPPTATPLAAIVEGPAPGYVAPVPAMVAGAPQVVRGPAAGVPSAAPAPAAAGGGPVPPASTPSPLIASAQPAAGAAAPTPVPAQAPTPSVAPPGLPTALPATPPHSPAMPSPPPTTIAAEVTRTAGPAIALASASLQRPAPAAPIPAGSQPQASAPASAASSVPTARPAASAIASSPTAAATTIAAGSATAHPHAPQVPASPAPRSPASAAPAATGSAPHGATPVSRMSPPLAVVLAQPAQAAAIQDSIAPLLQNLAALQTRLASLPQPVADAAIRLLAARLPLDRGAPSAGAIKLAVQRSGVFLEAPGRSSAQASDIKSALLQLRAGLTNLLGAGEISAVAPVMRRPPPPLRDAQPRGMRADAASLGENATPRETARTLLQQTDSALSRLKLTQLAAQPGGAESARAAAAAPDFTVELPMTLGAELAIAQLQVQRDGKSRGKAAGRGWRVRFAVSFSAIGEVGAQVALLGTSASVVVWAQEDTTADALEAMLPELAPALEARGLTVGSVRLRRGMPKEGSAPAGRLMDEKR